jgi:predicted RNA-binding protein YlxR (DUF448 family)
VVRRARPAAPPVLSDQPVRTCIGCRKRVPASELLRFVAVETGAGQFSLVPDPLRRRPGRGAHLHPGPGCFALAQRRRAFGRSLRVTGVVDTGELAEALFQDEPGSAPSAVGQPAHPQKQGRTTNMSTR